jgi:hypothetical protein
LADGGLRRFWVKYATRDEVELLKKGSHGTEEMRVAALMEPDDSPLYGFVRFRRRNVLVKYVPDGTSRVLKGERGASHARVSGWQFGRRRCSGR